MNYVRYVVVLIAAFFLMIPAFSMPDDGHSIGYSDNQQKTFDNQNSMMGPDGHQQIGTKSMMGNDGPKIVCLTICKVIGGGQEQAGTKSMMGEKGLDGKDKTCGCQNSVKGQGQDGQQNSWNDGQQKTCGCQAGQEQAGTKSMMGEKGLDGKDKTCGCQNSVKGQGQDDQQKTCGCQAGQEQAGTKSMMGEKGQDGQQNSWNDGQQKTCSCQNSVKAQGQDGQQNSWNDGQQKTSHKSMDGQDGQQNSWNDSQDQ